MKHQNLSFKTIRFSLLITFAVFSFSLAHSQTEINVNGVFWSDLGITHKDTQNSETEKPTIQPEVYRTVSIDIAALNLLLSSAPLESQVSAKESTAIISLPLPDGSSEFFSFVNSPVMAPELADKYPEIQVFLGQGVENPSHTVRFDLTPQGFHAMILNSGSTVYIDPFTVGDLSKCISYTKASFYKTTDKVHGGCAVGSDDLGSFIDNFSPSQGKQVKTSKADPNEILQMGMQLGMQKSMAASNGATLRTYRLALACTGEYAAFHGGTTGSALAAMNTSMARVNGIFEKDVCLRMVIVANNDEVIFLDSDLDPYANVVDSAMITQNQITCDNNIGSGNYDIGHVFAKGYGNSGLASLRSPCTDDRKARAITGRNNPVGDPFDIDFVAHEMGHQWGGYHTKNNSYNRSSVAAFEPGSASTIMGYAGICPPNLQSNSDEHFHNHSINQMVTYSANGHGNTCDVPTATNNSIPTVTTFNSGSTIPANTPFELTAEGADSDGDAITFNWEQYDLGPETASGDYDLTNPSGNQPIFRSWPSSTSGTRVFPRLSDLVNGTSVIGELLPTYSRGLKFKCTVRDNVAGGGAFVDDLISLSVDGDSGPFVVTSPTGSVPNGFATVTWDVAGTDSSPVNCSTVEILLSTDGGYTYPIQLASGVANDGSAVALIPSDVVTSSARFKVKGENNVFFNISDSNVIITQADGVGGADWDIAIQGVSGLDASGCGTSVTPVINIVNLGIESVTSFTVAFDMWGAIGEGEDGDDFVWEGVLLSGASVGIPLCPDSDGCIDLGSGSHVIHASVSLVPDNNLDEDLSNNESATSFEIFGNDEITVTLTTDNYPEETSWTIEDDNGFIVMSGGPYSSQVTEYITSACIDYGCYTLTVNDSWGDGLSIGVNGDYELTNSEGDVLAEMLEADFGLEEEHQFCLESSAVSGCMDETACNYDLDATNDDGSCEYVFDCAGTCGGELEIDCCGVCGGDNSQCSNCCGMPFPEDCSAACYADNCGVCDDNPENDCVQDCAGTWGGDAVVDECGFCDDNPENDCVQDCAGTWGGDAVVDECGVCDDNSFNDCVQDMCGVWGGSGYEDQCGVCNDDASDDCVQDECGVWGGTGYADECGECDDDATNDCVQDECGVWGGSGIPLYYCNCEGTIQDLDLDGICDPDDDCIALSENDCVQDCAGTWGGDAVVDECGVCGGSGIAEGDCDCDGNVLDELGVCGGGCPYDFDGNGICDDQEIYGCTYTSASNYNSEATADDGSCVLEPCTGGDCPFDSSGDGEIGSADLLDFLITFGSSCEVADTPWMCGDFIEHDSYDYSTVQIGDQCWFSENCRYLPEVSPSSEGSATEPHYYVYDYEGTDVSAAQATENYATYCVLYNWPAVMTEGICPSGWHIPSDEEFTELTDFLGGEGVAGGKMKEAGYDHWNSPNTGATNSSGWNGLPGGLCYSGGFYNNGSDGYWWSASESGSYSWERGLVNFSGSVYRYGYIRGNGFSARCVRD